MKSKYLTQDINGTFSKIRYGVKGDEVIICGRNGHMVKVFNKNNKETFFTNETNLSDVPVPRNILQPMSNKVSGSKGKK